MHCQQYEDACNRREFLTKTGLGLGAATLAHLFGGEARAATAGAGGLPGLPHFAPKAKRVICLFQSGGPSHLDLFDDKPVLRARFDEDLPDSIRKGQRITGMVASQARLALQPSKWTFAPSGQSGTVLSELLPHTRGIADEICLVRSLHTDAINHDPAITFFQTGSQLPGRPSMGAWLDYGLGRINENLPSFVVLISVTKDAPGQGLLARLWGSGFLPSAHQGVQFRSAGDPVLYLGDPAGLTRERRRLMLDGMAELNRQNFARVGDPEIETRIAQAELAFRMQSSVPELANVKSEPQHILDLYGPEVSMPGKYAANCLLARRLAERGVRFIQLFHMGWDHHGNLPNALRGQCKDTDQPTAALIQDLKQHGLLDDTLIVWGGEFGRTVYTQGALTENYGRDHHPRCFSLFLAGGGVKLGVTHGETDDYCYNIVKDGVHVRDLHATILHQLGIDHERFTYPFNGLDAKLTGVEPARVVSEILA